MIRRIAKIWPYRGRGRIIALLSFLHRLTGTSASREIAAGIKMDFNLSVGIERSMYFDFYENTLLRVIAQELLPGDTVIDVGANIGYISAHMAAAVGTNGTIHSLEPSTRVYGRLAAFAERANRHGYKIRVEQTALWDSPGQTRLTYPVSDNIGWISSVDGFMKPHNVVDEETVPRVRLDDYVDRHVQRIPKLTKIDVEGAEYFVLDGLTNFFESGHRPAIICEIAPNSFKHFGRQPGDLFSPMHKYGYSASTMDGQNVEATDLMTTTNVVWRAA